VSQITFSRNFICGTTMKQMS